MRRVIKASDHSMAGLEVAEEGVRLHGSSDSFIYADEKGVSLVGSLSILAQPQNIRIGASYLFPTAYQGQIPSSLASPQAMFVEDSPIEGFSNLASEVTSFLGELI